MTSQDPTPLILRGPPGIGEEARGQALVSRHGFSARYDLDPATGQIVRESHDLYGESIVARIVVFPTAKGGVATSWRLLDLVDRGTAPLGLIFGTTNPVMVQGAVLAGIPIMDRLLPDPAANIVTGDWVTMIPKEGIVQVKRRRL